MQDKDWMDILKTLSEQAENQNLQMPPSGRFKAMAKEVLICRKALLFQDTLIFLCFASVLLATEFALLRFSGLLFLIVQSLAISAGPLWLGISRHFSKEGAARH